MEKEKVKMLIIEETFELKVLKILDEISKKSTRIYVPPAKIKTGKYANSCVK